MMEKTTKSRGSSSLQRAGAFQLHVRQWGEPGAPVVVLLHGLIVSSRYMIPLGRALSGDFRVFALDLPGFGRSNAGRRALSTSELGQAVADWLIHSGHQDVIVIANSYGCQVAVEAERMAASHIRKMIFIGPTLDPKANTIPRQAVRLARGLPHDPWWFLLVAAFDLFFCGITRALATAKNMTKHDLAQCIPALQTPVVFFRGRRDYVSPHTWIAQVAESLESSVVVSATKGAHVVHARFPEVLVELAKAPLGSYSVSAVPDRVTPSPTAAAGLGI